MIIKNAEFIKSAADKSGFMSFDKPVIAVCGRSNVGKSSFINMLSNRKKLARTSREPGRTRLVNYFDFGEFVLADLPGYGFAQVSKGEKIKWARTIESFFASRQHIDHAFLLLDLRREPNADDIDFINYLNHFIIPFTIICTKSDKFAKTRIKPAVKAIADRLALGEDNLIAVSNESSYGKEKVLMRLDKIMEAYAISNEVSLEDDSQEESEGEDE
ncbi:MAG: YihA family ribosome biogenesis GTP-binding protein [Clostridiales bacterium]|nr:YihA family ribosome biogenesis GTP-binding protein [Clostridiales bacterium]